MRNILLIFSILILASCKRDTPAPDMADQRTVLVYLAGDNNLSAETDEKIEALRKSYLNGMGRLIVYKDAAGLPPQLIEISQNNSLKVLKSYPEENSASAIIFKKVLDDVQQLAPAGSYGLILFSHASGWLPARTLTQPHAVAQDGKEDLELPDFAEVIPDDFFDFMIFEACFMSGIEVVYQLRNKTDYILASSAEILSPGFTPLYPDLLPLLYLPQADLKEFGRRFFDHYNAQPGDYQSATISLIKTDALQALADWLKQFAPQPLPQSIINTIQHYDRYNSYRLFFDFEDYYQRFLPVQSHVELNRLLQEVVVYKASTPSFMLNYSGFKIDRFSGITTYIPQQEFNFLNEEYKKLSWPGKKK